MTPLLITLMLRGEDVVLVASPIRLRHNREHAVSEIALPLLDLLVRGDSFHELLPSFLLLD